MAIAFIDEIVGAFLGGEGGEGEGYCCDERVQGSGGSLSQQSFELGEELFDGIEVGAVGRQVSQLGAGSFDCIADAGDLMASEIVHDDDVAWSQDRHEELLDVSLEACAIHRSVEHAWRHDVTDAQSCYEGCGFPMSPRYR